MSDPGGPYIFRWRASLLAPGGPPPLRRYVLLALSLHGDAAGGSCYPSGRRLAQDTGLSRPTIIKHLRAAVREGWIERYARGHGGRGWRRYGYRLTLPTGAGVVNEVYHAGEVVTHVDHARARGGQPGDTKVVNDVDLSMSNGDERSSRREITRVRAHAREAVPVLTGIIASEATPAPTRHEPAIVTTRI